MYHLDDPLTVIKGIGPKLAESFSDVGFDTVKDLLMHLPFRYEDRSERFTIDQIKQLAQTKEKKLFTLEAFVKSSRSNYVRGRTMQSATLVDETGTITASWFNNPYIVKRLKTNESYLFSGSVSVSKRGQIYLTQPIVEDVNRESIHTSRLVPIYSNIPGLLATNVRKFQKEILDHLTKIDDPLEQETGISLYDALSTIHFPEADAAIPKARERFAIEELILLIEHSKTLKEEWKKGKTTVQIQNKELKIPNTIPFELTTSQQRSAKEIISDLTQQHPMNRLLIGDVGSGKTIVAGLAMQKIVEAGYFAALVAPTQILAEQHSKTLQKFFPNIPIYVVTGTSKPELKTPGFIVGTHAVLNLFKVAKSQRNSVVTQHAAVLQLKEKAHSPSTSNLTTTGLIVFDEQHRFGVAQRSTLEHAGIHPHVLTMTATPIPRSLMLTIFSHLSLSTIDELPKNRLPTKTWLVPEEKRGSMYEWIRSQLSVVSDKLSVDTDSKNLPPTTDDRPPTFQTIIVCPFINPSEQEALENVAAAKEMYERVKGIFSKKKGEGDKGTMVHRLVAKQQSLKATKPNNIVESRSSRPLGENAKRSVASEGKPATNYQLPITVSLLHSKLKKKEKDQVIADLFSGKTQILVTTPIVEVGVDLPQAAAIIIEASERFGLASLHQLRGRVGRAGQQGYCILFTNSKSQETKARLKKFETISSGQKLAEIDLQRRGAGDLFGTQQHGFDDLKFSSWTDLEIIHKAQQIAQKFDQTKQKYVSPILKPRGQKVVLAN